MRLESTCKPRKGLGLFASLFASQLSFQLSTLSSLRLPSTQPSHAVAKRTVVDAYRKPPNISPLLIFVRKHILVGLYMGELIYTGGLIYEQDFVLVVLTIY